MATTKRPAASLIPNVDPVDRPPDEKDAYISRRQYAQRPDARGLCCSDDRGAAVRSGGVSGPRPVGRYPEDRQMASGLRGRVQAKQPAEEARSRCRNRMRDIDPLSATRRPKHSAHRPRVWKQGPLSATAEIAFEAICHAPAFGIDRCMTESICGLVIKSGAAGKLIASAPMVSRT